MITNVVAKRYSQALLESVEDPKKLEATAEALKWAIRLILENRELGDALKNSSIKRDRRKAILDEVGRKADMPPLVVRLFKLLVDNNRLGELEAIGLKFDGLVDEALNREEAEITTAYPLSEKQQEEIRLSLSRITGKDIYLDIKEDPRILGGIVAKVGTLIIDGSVRTQLEKLREELLVET
jgi:F-type H+-transporting ATPase subunit delta